jgi:hypothetical protein
MGSVYPALDKDEPPEGRPKEGDQKEELGQERAQDDWKQHREEVIPDHDCEGLVCPFLIEDEDGDVRCLMQDQIDKLELLQKTKKEILEAPFGQRLRDDINKDLAAIKTIQAHIATLDTPKEIIRKVMLEHQEEKYREYQEEKHLERACEEVQRESKEAKTQALSEACQAYNTEIKTALHVYNTEIEAAKSKLDSHIAGKPGIIRLPEIHRGIHQGSHPNLPHPSHQEPEIEMDTHENITDDEGENDPCHWVQFMQQASDAPKRASDCMTTLAEGFKKLTVQKTLKRRQEEQEYQDHYHDYQDTQTRDRNHDHSAYLAGGKNRHPQDKEEPDRRKDGVSDWINGACNIAVNSRNPCRECGKNNFKIEFAQDGSNLREFLCLIRQAEVVVKIEMMIRKRDEANSKRQRKKLDKQIRKKGAKCSASHTLNKIIMEDKASTKKELTRQQGKEKHHGKRVHNNKHNTTLDCEREDQLEWAHGFGKYTEEWEEPESLDKDRQEDRKYKEISGKLVETFLKWRLTDAEEMKAAEDIVTISSSESGDEPDWDWQQYRAHNEFNDGYKCKCRGGHKTKKATIECIAQKDYEPEMEIWEEAVNELGKAIKREREELATKPLANHIRVEALVMGIRREGPAEPTFTGGDKRPNSQECHQGDLYQEAKRQVRQEGPPKYAYVYDCATDIWLKYLTSPQDVLTHILGKISQTAERKAIRSKIESMVTLSKCIQEITHREEVARKGYAVGKNLRQYDGGRKIEKKAKRIIIKWEYERARTAEIQRNLTRMAAEPPRRPGPTTKCDGCQLVPDSRLLQCKRCKQAFYCTILCQKRAWRRHKDVCGNAQARSYDLTRSKRKAM